MSNRKYQLHTSTGRWQLGLCLSLIVAFLWGILPIALKSLLDRMDAYTIACYRFLIAGILLSIFVISRKRLPAASKLRGPVLWLFVIAIIMLCSNYVTYGLGLDYLSPSTATIVMQLMPIFLLLGSFIIFKESFSLRQWSGFAVLILGLVLFFNDRLVELLSSLDNYTVGVLLVVAASLFWAIYAMAQKQLLRTFATQIVLLIIYIACGLLLLPFANLTQVMQLNNNQLLLLVFCGLNTMIAYGCLVEALNHWEASRISMVLATTPLITIISVKCCAIMFPDFVSPEQLNAPSILGAVLVVVGSALSALSRVGSKKSI